MQPVNQMNFRVSIILVVNIDHTHKDCPPLGYREDCPLRDVGLGGKQQLFRDSSLTTKERAGAGGQMASTEGVGGWVLQG